MKLMGKIHKYSENRLENISKIGRTSVIPTIETGIYIL